MFVHQDCTGDSSPPEIWLRGKDGTPERFEQQFVSLNLDQREESFALVFLRANESFKCDGCRHLMEEHFSTPKCWFEVYFKRHNGYFGSQDIGTTGLMTWARFLIKFVENEDKNKDKDKYENKEKYENKDKDKYEDKDKDKYEDKHENKGEVKDKDKKQKRRNYWWLKLNIMTYAPSAGNQIMLVFDATKESKDRLVRCLMDGKPNEEMADDLFWVYYRLLNDVNVSFHDSIWGLRTAVRGIEVKEDADAGEKDIDRSYRNLHDLARHAIHIAETATNTVSTFERICAAHDQYAAAIAAAAAEPEAAPPSRHASTIRKRVQDRLLLHRQVLIGLQHRALATKDRLHNEIQLSFNTVVKNDSSVMKSIARLTLLFLPATFVSAVFSMSFFNYSQEMDSWTVSGRFWVYWVVAVPLTVMAVVSFQFWGQQGEPGLWKWPALLSSRTAAPQQNTEQEKSA